jgi:hypothetical protein
MSWSVSGPYSAKAMRSHTPPRMSAEAKSHGRERPMTASGTANKARNVSGCPDIIDAPAVIAPMMVKTMMAARPHHPSVPAGAAASG